MSLFALTPEAKSFVVPELASGQRELWQPGELRGVLSPFPTRREVDLDRLDARLDELFCRVPKHDARFDALVAPELHTLLPLTRREAAEPGVWRWLAVVHRPDLVRHRWENRSWAQMRRRFWSVGTRPDSNAFARLWWIAELTRDGSPDSYALTRRVFARQPLATGIFIRSLGHHRPAVVALVDVLELAPPDVVERTLRLFTAALSSRVLEAMDEASLRALVGELRERASSSP
ncbi:MAG: hypothetical protein H6722_06640 [Sandaracinus sp.]|nr:hypothetical protein [Sandaracinus sp.]MCB9612116.1 hypothetical protein [Sandaracinus sp.]MCB9623476.1 hypothetical protein [Sandaracinus sp.]